MQVCTQNSRFSMNIWSITDECSRLITHLNRHSLLHVNRRRHVGNKRCPLINCTSATWVDSCIWRKSPKLRRRQIVQKHLETPKDVAIKSEETHVWDRALPSCKFSHRLAKISIPGKNTYFSFSPATPLGATIPCYTFFLKSSRRANVTPQLTRNAVTYHFWDICGQNLGFWGSLRDPKGETVSGTHI